MSFRFIKPKLEVICDRRPDASQQFGYRYASLRALSTTEAVQPLFVPHVSIAVADLIP